MDYNQLTTTFKSKFDSSPRIFRSPGRINIIGEHTDYNDGFVLPAAVDKEIGMLIADNGEDTINIYAADEDESVSFTLENYREVKTQWAQYIIGVIDQLLKKGFSIKNFDCVFAGNIPMGAGMSSSAALECATVFALDALNDLDLERDEMIRIAQSAENHYVGVKCGIMDQFASVFSEKGKALKLDCRDLSYAAYDLKLADYKFVLVDTLVKHSLASSEYNVRRKECEAGLAVLQSANKTLKALRDVSLDELPSKEEGMDEVVFKRCKYIVEEIARVNQACVAMDNGDLIKLGALMYATHHGLQHEFQVSCDELDFLVDQTRNKNYVIGARMMGGGFGGCTINLVKTSALDKFTDEIKEAYATAFGKEPAIYSVKTAAGTSEITKEVTHD